MKKGQERKWKRYRMGMGLIERGLLVSQGNYLLSIQREVGITTRGQSLSRSGDKRHMKKQLKQRFQR